LGRTLAIASSRIVIRTTHFRDDYQQAAHIREVTKNRSVGSSIGLVAFNLVTRNTIDFYAESEVASWAFHQAAAYCGFIA
jgi:hypothetical protein